MVKEIGQFAVRYSKDLKDVIIAFMPHSTYLSTHLEVYNRLQGIAKPTGNYSRVTLNDKVYLGIHFENDIPETQLMQALSQ